MLVKGGHENHLRLALGPERLEHVEAVLTGHLNVEKKDIGRMLPHRGDSGVAVLALGDNLDASSFSSRRRRRLRAIRSSSARIMRRGLMSRQGCERGG